MNISAKTEYACIAVLELSANYGRDQPVRIRDIADAHGIPSRFLVQILLQLKGAGLVSSTRGAAGGYRLALDPADITLGQVMSLVDGRPVEIQSSTTGPSATSETLLRVWRKVADVQREMLSDVTFAELVQRVGKRTENMYYI